jgi:hypothetical protein
VWVGVGDACVHEKHIEVATGETFVQRRDLIWFRYVEGLDFDTALMLVRQFVQLGSATVSHRANDVPTLRQKFGGHGEAKTS